MSTEIPFANEASFMLPSSDRWFNPSARNARVFVKGPSEGVNEETGLCVLLHGVGGRQNDISWKKLRRDICDKFNVIALGVNFFGTDLMQIDSNFVTEQFHQVYRFLRQNPDFAKAFEAGQMVNVAPSDFTYFENPLVAYEAVKPVASEFWDWGVMQGLDVINAISWVLQETGIQPKRVSMVSRSAGAQVAYMLLKLLPKAFAGYLDIGGACYGGSKAPWLESLLKDPLGRLAEGGKAFLDIENRGPDFRIRMERRLPLMNLGGLPGTGAKLKDEVAIRNVMSASHFAAEHSLSMLAIEQGENDSIFPLAYKREFVSHYEGLGADCRLRTIGESDRDTSKRIGTGHTFAGDFGAIVVEDYPELFAAERREEGALIEEGEHRFACESGDFVLSPSVESTLRFEAKR